MRSEATYGSIPAETLSEVIQRVDNEAEDYIDWDEFIQYFTKRGKPIGVEYTKGVPRLTRNYGGLPLRQESDLNDNYMDREAYE